MNYPYNRGDVHKLCKEKQHELTAVDNNDIDHLWQMYNACYNPFGDEALELEVFNRQQYYLGRIVGILNSK